MSDQKRKALTVADLLVLLRGIPQECLSHKVALEGCDCRGDLGGLRIKTADEVYEGVPIVLLTRTDGDDAYDNDE